MTKREESEAWLRGFCASADCPDYGTMMPLLEKAWNSGGSYSYGEGEDYGYFNVNWGGWDGNHLHFGGKDAHGEIPRRFWEHVEVVLGIDIPKDNRPEYFSCSC